MPLILALRTEASRSQKKKKTLKIMYGKPREALSVKGMDEVPRDCVLLTRTKAS